MYMFMYMYMYIYYILYILCLKHVRQGILKAVNCIRLTAILIQYNNVIVY